ncbi:MAG TPA: ATP-binding protein [Gemmataceae bacterium]|nr:ATP-binding protein [Gemmataceae bacterium]
METLPMMLTLPSDLRLLPLALGFVETVCQIGGLDKSTTDAVVLATNEAVNNVFRHAHRDQPNAFLQIQCSLAAGGIEICLLDEGEPFNLSEVPYFDPAEMRLGGRGVYLMRSLMDELNCHPRGERGNALRMVKRCRPNLAASNPV